MGLCIKTRVIRRNLGIGTGSSTGTGTELVRKNIILTGPNKKNPGWYCLLRFSGKNLEFRYCSGISRTVLSSPVSSRFFPGFSIFPEFSRVTRPENISLVPVPPVREMSSSLVSSRLVQNELGNADLY